MPLDQGIGETTIIQQNPVERYTLPPIIMEVENGPQKETKVIFQAPIFHFHDYGRKSRCSIHFPAKTFSRWNQANESEERVFISTHYRSLAGKW